MSERIQVAHTGRYFDRDWAAGEVVEVTPAEAERMLRLVDQVGRTHIHPFVRWVETPEPDAQPPADGPIADAADGQGQTDVPASERSQQADAGAGQGEGQPEAAPPAGDAAESAGE